MTRPVRTRSRRHANLFACGPDGRVHILQCPLGAVWCAVYFRTSGIGLKAHFQRSQRLALETVALRASMCRDLRAGLLIQAEGPDRVRGGTLGTEMRRRPTPVVFSRCTSVAVRILSPRLVEVFVVRILGLKGASSELML